MSGASLSITVPASTSNLGTGFDCLGLALDLRLEVRAVPATGAAHEVRVEGPAAGGWPAAPADDLLLRAFDAAAAHLGLRREARAFRVWTEVPVARGLGSSGAAVAAGLLLAAALSGGAERAGLLELGIELEGHPDNVTASLLGGCTLCVPGTRGADGVPLHLQLPVHGDIAFALAWPATGVRTSAARAALPPGVPLADAVENARRLPLLLEGLRSARPELLAAGGEDRLHERFRLPLVPGAAQALAAARGEGAWLAVLSGSGSAVLALCPAERARATADSMARELERAGGAPATARVARAAREAPTVREA